MPCQMPDRTPRYTEDEQRRRWSLIIQAILNDPGVDAPTSEDDSTDKRRSSG
jgi:hypothetical protein